MSIIDTFDNETGAIIDPTQLSPPIDGFPKIAVVTFGDRFIDVLRDEYETKQLGAMRASVTVPIYQINHRGTDIAVYCSTIGGPATAGLFEEMISKGCERFLFFGSCGVLDREITAQSLIIPTAAYRDEGTSYHYAPPGDYIDVPTAVRLAEIFTELNLPHVCGKTWTTDAMYRETRGNMEKRRRDGCITVDMECASIMAVAQFRGVAAYQFFYAADSLDAIEWDMRTLGSMTMDSRAKLLRIALEAAARL